MITYIKDEDEDLVIPCGLGPVICDQSADDWIIAARKGEITDLSMYRLQAPSRDSQYYSLLSSARDIIKMPTFENGTVLRYSDSCRGSFSNCSSLLYADLSTVLRIENGEGICFGMFGDCTSMIYADMSSIESFRGRSVCSAMFRGCTSLKTVNLGKLQSIGTLNGGYYEGYNICSGMFTECAAIETLDLRSLKSITGDRACDNMYSFCRSLKTVNLSGLENVSGYLACVNMFTNCTSLEFVDLGSLTYIGNDGNHQIEFQFTFNNCPAFKSVRIHPYGLKFNDTPPNNNNPLHSAVNIENIELTAQVTDDFYMTKQANLTADSVFEILSNLDLSVNNKSVNFYSGGLTVTDFVDGRLQTAYDNATAAGWTINNLTIVPNS